MISIKNVYAGKPDANDEIRERGYDVFVDSYIEPTGINIENLANVKYGTSYFVMGDKVPEKRLCFIIL